MTQQGILDLINEIQTAAFYPATKMNPLLTNILAAAYGPLYFGEVPPGDTDDENSGYRPGSVGYDTITERFYICSSALAGNADWVLIPSDAKFTIVNYRASTTNTAISTDTNVSIVKVTNASILNTGNSIKLPDSPYPGKTVVVYFNNAINQFTIRNSDNVAVNGATSLSIPAGQQYTFTYSGTAWEIVGVNNSTAGAVSGVNASNSGGTVVTNASNLKFLGSAVTVTNAGSGVADITINPLSGIDVSDGGANTVAAAQEINFVSNFSVAADGTTANVTFLPKIGIRQNNVDVSTPSDNVTTLNFAGTMFSINPVVISGGTRCDITLNGAKLLLLSGDLIPTNFNDETQGYSRGSLGRNTGTLQRTWICRSPTTNQAVWDLVTEDAITDEYVISTGQSQQINYGTANVTINSASMTVAAFTLTAPRYAYLGKRLFIYSSVNITNLIFQRADSTSYFNGPVSMLSGIVMVCTNVGDGINQVWRRIA